MDGIIDIIRMFYFGMLIVKEKKVYILVFKGNIVLDLVVFFKGISGFVIDVMVC